MITSLAILTGAGVRAAEGVVEVEAAPLRTSTWLRNPPAGAAVLLYGAGGAGATAVGAAGGRVEVEAVAPGSPGAIQVLLRRGSGAVG